jgi:hypothetical protein
MADSLTCPACGFANEPERVYCHNCGGKLDRSLLPVVEGEKSKESADAARRRIKRMTNPAGFSPLQTVKSLFSVLFWAALIAGLFLISQKPDGVPEEKKELPAQSVREVLMDALQAPTPRTVTFSEDDINAALKQSVKRAATGAGSLPGVEFQRAYATLTPGLIHIGTQQAVWGYPVFSGVDYKLMIIDGKFTPILLGGNLGRLPIRVEAMKYLDVAFQKLWAALQREHEQMARMQSVTIGKGQIVFVTKGASGR